MIQKDVVSVIIPIYNAQNYLRECVSSIISQTYSNIQIILINDGSTDESWKICKELEKIDSRIIAVTQENGGVSVARNTGLSMATGKWIMFVDPDDALDKKIIEKLLNKLDKETDIVACSCYGFTGKEHKTASFFKNDRVFFDDKTDLFLQLSDLSYGQSGEIFTAIGVPWGKLYRHSFLKKYNLKFNPKLRRMQDNVFNMYAFTKARKIYYLNKPLYFYRLDHINSFVLSHFKNFENLFLPVIQEKYRCLEREKLYSNPLIYKAYVTESANVFFNIINSTVSLKSNFKEIQDKINWLKNLKCFVPLFEEDISAQINDRKLKIKLFLIKHKLYRTYILALKV